MSYILDALTKAAKQRDRQAPVLERLLVPAARPAPGGTRASTRLLAALGLNAVLATLLLLVWLRAAPFATPPSPPAPAAPVQETLRSPARELPPPPPSPIGVTPPAVLSVVAPQVSPPPAAPRLKRAEPAPPAAPAPRATGDAAGLRLEALIYSDLPARRLIFVNGRKYVEGDVIDGRLRVEQIQEDGVLLSAGGRRITLRVAR